jgi:hypothetical protein
MALTLDRMEIEESGRADPERLAAAIHRQLGDAKGAVPVYEIARALDIIEIRECQVDHFEGALVTEAERNEGIDPCECSIQFTATALLDRSRALALPESSPPAIEHIWVRMQQERHGRGRCS